MKKLLAVLAVCACILSISCNKPVINDPEVIPITVNFKDTLALAPLDFSDIDFGAITLPLAVSVEDTLRGINPLVDIVEDVHLESLTLVITGPDGFNWDFLDDMAIYVYTDDRDPILMAFEHNIPNGLNTRLELTPVYENRLDDWVKVPEPNLHITMLVGGLPSISGVFAPIEMEAIMSLDVTLINY